MNDSELKLLGMVINFLTNFLRREVLTIEEVKAIKKTLEILKGRSK